MKSQVSFNYGEWIKIFKSLTNKVKLGLFFMSNYINKKEKMCYNNWYAKQIK